MATHRSGRSIVPGLRDAVIPTLTAAPAHLRRVFESLRIGPVVIPNRVARTGHLTKFALGSINDDLIAYHAARATSGVGLTVLEACAVHPSSVLGMTGFDDSVIPGYRRLMDAVRPHGMRVFQQLLHGAHVYNASDGAPPGALPSWRARSVGSRPCRCQSRRSPRWWRPTRRRPVGPWRGPRGS